MKLHSIIQSVKQLEDNHLIVGVVYARMYCILFDRMQDSHGPCRAHAVFIPDIRLSILNELTFQVTWLQMTRHHLHDAGVAA